MNIDMNLKKLSDQKLIDQTDVLAKTERTTTVQMLHHLREIEVRRLFVELGHSSMYNFCLHRLKYSEGQVQRRLSSARVLTELPEIETQITNGEINLTNLSKVQTFVRAEKTAHRTMNRSEKLEIVQKVANKSTREVERELLKQSNQPELLAEKFKISPNSVNELNYLKLELHLSPEHQALLNEVKNLYAHELSDSSNNRLVVFLLEKALQFKKKS